MNGPATVPIAAQDRHHDRKDVGVLGEGDADGSTKPLPGANTAPAAPAIAALIAQATILKRVAAMPSTAAASSFSRIATNA